MTRMATKTRLTWKCSNIREQSIYSSWKRQNCLDFDRNLCFSVLLFVWVSNWNFSVFFRFNEIYTREGSFRGGRCHYFLVLFLQAIFIFFNENYLYLIIGYTPFEINWYYPLKIISTQTFIDRLKWFKNLIHSSFLILFPCHIQVMDMAAGYSHSIFIVHRSRVNGLRTKTTH